MILLRTKEPLSMEEKIHFLQKNGYQVLVAESTKKAVQLLQTNPKIVLLLMDIELYQNTDNTTVIEKLVKKHSIPLVLQIPENQPETINHIIPSAYVSKTASPFMLKSTIESAIAAFQAQQKQKKEIAELRQKQNLHQALMNNIQEGVILVDKNDKILFVNHYFCQLIEYKKEELIGKIGYQFLVEKNERKSLLERNESRLKGISEKYELTMIKKSGKLIIFFMNASPVYDENHACIGSMATCLDITERKQAEKKARQSKNLLRLILDTLPVSVFIKDKKFRYLDCNLAFAKDAGFEHTQDVIGKTDDDLIWKNQAKLYQALGKEIISSEKAKLNIEEPQIYPDGRKRWVKTNLIPLHDEENKCIGLLGTYEDITKQKETQNKLLQSEITYRGIINSIEEAIYIQDEKGIFLDVNNAVEKLYGYPKEYFIGKTPEFLSAEGKNNLPAIAEAIKKAFDGSPQQFELWGKRKDGTIFPKEVSLSPGYYFGKKAIIAVARNIQDRKEKEKQIMQLLKDKETLLQEVHHRIKNNMGIISSLLSLQINSTSEEKIIAALQDAKSRIQTMMVLYDKLYRTKHFKRISSQDFLSSLVDEILSIFPNHKSVKVKKEIANLELEEKKISALGIIIAELITNTMKYAYTDTEEKVLKISLEKNLKLLIDQRLIFEDSFN